MSGFVASINCDGAPLDPVLLERLTDSLAARGPDRRSVWSAGPVGFGHTLFRTTAEARYDDQPATLDGQVWIAGCIRIDAREELRDRLGLAGSLRLSHTPDAHLVLHAYRAWGEDCLEYLLGDFAFALWDAGRQALFCARDRFGLRQLCYARTGDTFVASNSIHTLRQHPAVSGRLSDQAIADFLLFGDHRWGSRGLTAFADIHALEPGHCLTLTGGQVSPRRYWQGPGATPLLKYAREADYLEHFRQVLRTAVADRLRTDRAVVALSGGMDSASIAATLRSLQRDDAPALTLSTASVLYNSLLDSDEEHYLRLVGGHLALPLRLIDAGRYPLLDPPLQTTQPLELYQPQLWFDLGQRALASGRVMLTGDGGDELLTGGTLLASLRDAGPAATLSSLRRLKRVYGTAPSLGSGLARRARSRAGRRGGVRAPFPYPAWLDRSLERELGLRERWQDFWTGRLAQTCPRPGRHPGVTRALMTPDWNADDIFLHPGRTTVEQRSPFLDVRCLQFVQSLPALPWLFKKHLLRTLMQDQLPPAVTARPKTALGPLQDALLATMDRARLRNVTLAPELARYVDPLSVGRVATGARDPAASYVDLRPLLLNTWLLGLQ